MFQTGPYRDSFQESLSKLKALSSFLGYVELCIKSGGGHLLVAIWEVGGEIDTLLDSLYLTLKRLNTLSADDNQARFSITLFQSLNFSCC